MGKKKHRANDAHQTIDFVILQTACLNISLYVHNKCLDKPRIHYSALKCPIPLDNALQIPGNLIYKLHDSLKKLAITKFESQRM